MYLNHDHSKRESIRFLAVWPFFQYLWCSPPRGETTLTLGTPHGIQVQSHRSEPKVRDTRITRVIDEDVWLDTCQRGSKTGVRTTTYPLEVPVNHIAGVEVTEAPRNVG